MYIGGIDCHMTISRVFICFLCDVHEKCSAIYRVGPHAIPFVESWWRKIIEDGRRISPTGGD